MKDGLQGTCVEMETTSTIETNTMQSDIQRGQNFVFE